MSCPLNKSQAEKAEKMTATFYCCPHSYKAVSFTLHSNRFSWVLKATNCIIEEVTLACTSQGSTSLDTLYTMMHQSHRGGGRGGIGGGGGGAAAAAAASDASVTGSLNTRPVRFTYS